MGANSEGSSRERRTIPDGSSSAENPDSGSERPLAWCFYTTLHDEFLSDSTTVWRGSRSVVIGKETGNDGVATVNLRVNALWQGVDAVPFRGSRIEVSARVKTSDVVALVLTTATELDLLPGNRQIRSLPAAHALLLPGSATDWTTLSVIGDIPADTDVLYYVVSNDGGTRLWVDDVRVTEVGPEVPITEGVHNVGAITFVAVNPSSILAVPSNLDFESTNRSQSQEISSNACGSVQIG